MPFLVRCMYEEHRASVWGKCCRRWGDESGGEYGGGVGEDAEEREREMEKWLKEKGG